MALSSTQLPIPGPAVRAVGLLLVAATGVLTVFVSQASSPDYRQLFWLVLGLACLHVVAAAVYLARVRSWQRWLALAIAVVAMVSVVEMALRVL